MAKRALIVGITGQDGSYLAELLLEKGYDVMVSSVGQVHSTPAVSITSIRIRMTRVGTASALRRSHGRVVLVKILRNDQPDEIYNLGAQSHVRVSFDNPEYTADVAARHPGILEAIRDVGIQPLLPGFHRKCSARCKKCPARNERPFGRAPLRRGKGVLLLDHRELPGELRNVCLNGILFNHESTAGETFVTRKITARAPPSNAASKTSYFGTWMHGVIGATRRSTSWRCG